MKLFTLIFRLHLAPLLHKLLFAFSLKKDSCERPPWYPRCNLRLQATPVVNPPLASRAEVVNPLTVLPCIFFL